MENKPSILYRGIKIDYNNLKKFKFTDVDLTVNYDPIIDKYGRKTIGDGNEYGVYMSDNLNMVLSAYGNLHNDGIPLYNHLKIYDREIMIPSIAIIYEINTAGLNIRKPFIVSHLEEHYNNGYQGDEWIADVVPANNYKLYRVRIGGDILHDAEDIDLLSVKNISEEVKQKLEMRKYRLEIFASDMEKIPFVKRNAFGSNELNILKSIYGKNGFKYIDENNLITSDVSGMLQYLIVKVFKQNEVDIDFQTIKYINSLKEQATNIDSLIEILKNDKIKNMQEKIIFEEKKKKEGTLYSTIKYDKIEKRLNNLMTMIMIRRRKDNLLKNEQTQNSTPIQDNTTNEEQEWEVIKDKYDYDELSPEKQIIIEKEFKEMIYKRRKQKFDINDKLFDERTESESMKNLEHRGRRM